MFDGLTTEFEPEIALDRPSAKALSHILRHRELWPKGFEWNYARCDRCAIGLARVLWLDHIPASSVAMLGRAVGLSPITASRIFHNLDLKYRVPHWKITPENVADAIDAYLAKPKESSHV